MSRSKYISELPSLDPGLTQDQWLESTPLLGLEDTRLRLTVQGLTQLKGSEVSRALAIYGFVKTLPFKRLARFRVHTARAVLDAKGAVWFGKSTLFVAMLRAAGIPARLRMVSLDAQTFAGLHAIRKSLVLPLVEAWMGGRWVRTDTHVYDPVTMSALRHRLRESGWSRGFGLHAAGQAMWTGQSDAFCMMALDQRDGVPLEDYGAYDDLVAFWSDLRSRRPHEWALRVAGTSMVLPALSAAIVACRRDTRA